MGEWESEAFLDVLERKKEERGRERTSNMCNLNLLFEYSQRERECKGEREGKKVR